MRIDFVRHGHCQDSAFLRGRSASLLSVLGQKQMHKALDALEPADLIISSPAIRCLDLVEAYYADKSEALNIEAWPDFQERFFGVWDGLSYDAIQALDVEGFTHYLDNPFDYAIPEAESLAKFENRVQQVFQKLLEHAVHNQLEHIVVVTHGGVMRVLLKQVLGLSDTALFQLEMGYAARMSLECIELTEAMQSDTEHCQKASDAFFIKLLELVQSPIKS
ncbi:MAG: alpha-ribazole phosphatase [Thiomicrorhabdus sp.]|nr:MAG: alpha-ribazole phosphatase [Thiomicrorhabdus sp.]